MGLYLATLPSFTGYLICFAAMVFFADVVYWPVLLKNTFVCWERKKNKGRMFGFLETGRGVVDVIVASGALFAFVQFGEGKAGMRAGLLFYTVITLVAGIVTYFIVDDDKVKGGEKTSANMEVLKGHQTCFCPALMFGFSFFGYFLRLCRVLWTDLLYPVLKDIICCR